MASIHYPDLSALHPQNLDVRLLVKTRYDDRFPQEVLPDRVSNLKKLEYPTFDTTGALGLSERRQGSEADLTNGSYSTTTVRAIEFAKKTMIREEDFELLVDVRNDAVDYLANLFMLKKSELKVKFLDNFGATKSGAADTVANTYTGTGTQSGFTGKYLTLSATRKWSNTSTGTPIEDILEAATNIREDEKVESQWIIWSTRASKTLLGRPDIQNLIAENPGQATATGRLMSSLFGHQVAEVDVTAKDPDTGAETLFNTNKVQVTAAGTFVGFNHMAEDASFVTIDDMAKRRVMEIELRTAFVPHVQRPAAVFTIDSIL